MKITKNNESFQVVLPKQVCLALGWKHGTNLKFKVADGGRLVLKAE
jgi:bifunctional DNA-binding transcriptional regulator/antitoxin component of YhaV-PrlF toxin-antitoxin module